MIDELISRYFDGGLSSDELAELKEQLRSSPKARALYWEHAEIHSLLDQASGEEQGTYSAKILLEDNITPLPRFKHWDKLAGIAALVIGMAYLMNRDPSGGDLSSEPPVQVATTSNGVDPRVLMSGDFSVAPNESTELIFHDGARVAFEGPASARLISPSRMRLHSGKIGVEVPKGAEGFTVETREGEIVDFGTRFGVVVEETGRMRAEVFEGRIDVNIGETVHRMEGTKSLEINRHNQAQVIQGSDARAYPMPSSHLRYSLQGSFNSLGYLPTGKPTRPDHWSGDFSRTVGPSLGVSPRGGAGMLQLISTSDGERAGDNVAGELWRIVDLENIRRKMGRNPSQVHLSGWFNRIAGDAETDTQFMISIAAYQALGENLSWENAVPLKSQTVVLSDRDEQTWERADLQISVSPSTRYLAVMIGAYENIHDDVDGGKAEFSGHFVDDVSMEFRADLRTSAHNCYWGGSDGDWQDARRWSANQLPRDQDRIIVQGGSLNISSLITTEDNSIIFARDNESTSEVVIGETGSLHVTRGETVVGYNRGAKAKVHLRGEWISNSPIFVGRNNHSSVLEVSGQLMVDNRISLSQYDSDPDTQSTLRIVDEGQVTARQLLLINDLSALIIADGSLEVGKLQVGGDNGEAYVSQSGGTVRCQSLSIGKGRYEITGGELWVKEPITQVEEYFDNATLTQEGDWTKVTP